MARALLLVAFALLVGCAIVSAGNKCGDRGKLYNPNKKTCCNGVVRVGKKKPCCGTRIYDRRSQTCCGGVIRAGYRKTCCGKLALKDTFVCCDGIPYYKGPDTYPACPKWHSYGCFRREYKCLRD